MKKLFAIGLLTCCMMVLAPLAGTAGAADVSTQGDLALKLAEKLGLTVTGTANAAETLTAMGIEPPGGWNLTAELTNAVLQNLADDVAGVTNGAVAFTSAVAELNVPAGMQSAANSKVNQGTFPGQGTGENRQEVPPKKERDSATQLKP